MIAAKINIVKIIAAKINKTLIYKNEIEIIKLYMVSYILNTNHTIIFYY